MGKPFWKTAFKDWGIVNYIQDVATGDNKVGGVLHGVLDNLPIANEPLGKLVKALISGDWLKAKEEFGKVLTVRHIVSLGVTVSIVMGWITIEDVKNFGEVFSTVFEYVTRFTK